MPPERDRDLDTSDVSSDRSTMGTTAEPLFGESMRTLPSPSPRGSVSFQSTRALSLAPPEQPLQSISTATLSFPSRPGIVLKATAPSQRQPIATNPLAAMPKQTMPAVLPEQAPITSPGYCALRLENIESHTSQEKKTLMNSVADDIGATFISIKRHIEAGTLEEDHTSAIENVIKLICHTDFHQRKLLRRRVHRLRKERNWGRKRQLSLVRMVNVLALRYRTTMNEKKKVLREAKDEIVKLRKERDLLKCVRMKGVEVPEVNMGEDTDAECDDGELEEDPNAEVRVERSGEDGFSSKGTEASKSLIL